MKVAGNWGSIAWCVGDASGLVTSVRGTDLVPIWTHRPPVTLAPSDTEGWAKAKGLDQINPGVLGCRNGSSMTLSTAEATTAVQACSAPWTCNNSGKKHR